MAMEGNGERCWGAVDKVVVVVRLRVCEREEWGSKNPKTERGDSVSGVPCETMVWGDDRRLLVQVYGMEAAGHLPMRGQWAGFVPKPQNRAFIAQFRPCGIKWRRGMMMGGCGCGWMAWRGWGDCAFANARPGLGFRPKNQNRVFVARFRA